MVIAVASGKGGTGKTTVATNLAAIAPGPVQLADCDVEEPNCHLFIHPSIQRTHTVTAGVPEIDVSRCDGCGKCAELCQFNALSVISSRVLVFPDLCHGCGGCMRFCPQHCIVEGAREVGVVEEGEAGGLAFVHGRLRIGEPQAPPLIRAVWKHARKDRDTIIDAPPGTSCSVVAALSACNFVLLVAEPTPFGMSDLKLTVELLRELALPFAVVINRCDIADDRLEAYCQEEGIDVLLRLPNSRRIAELCSKGELLVSHSEEMRQAFKTLWDKTTRACQQADTRAARIQKYA